jgi:prepilin-type N-terminal cleavage/methylation domain-containing protein
MTRLNHRTGAEAASQEPNPPRDTPAAGAPCGRTWLRAGPGFTLIEVLMAMAIFAGVMIAIYASWSAILRGSKAALDATADAQRLRVATRTLVDALTSVQMYQSHPALYAFIADTTGDFASVGFAAQLAPSFPGSGMFGDQGVRRVSFLVERGPNGGNQLTMTQAPLLAAQERGGEEPYSLVLARDVSLFSFEFWDLNSGRWVTEWASTNSLPALVRFAIGLGGGQNNSGRPRDVVTRLVSIPAKTIPRQYQVPQGAVVPGQPGPGAPGQPPGQPPGGQPGGGRPPGTGGGLGPGGRRP